MTIEAATPAGGAEGVARKPVPQQSTTGQFAGNGGQAKPSINDRLRASLFDSGEPQPDNDRAPPKQRAQAQGEQADAGDDQQNGEQNQKASPQGGDEEQGEQAQAGDELQQQEALGAEETQAEAGADGEQQEVAIGSLNDLAEGLGWDLEKVLDLETSIKIGGKDGKAKLRDIVKSYQLEGHLNQGLMKLAEERKGFEAETARKVGEVRATIGQLNNAVGLAQRILDGEFADVNWQELQRTDPDAFKAKYGAYTMRADGIKQLSQVVQQENERAKAEQQAALSAYLGEQTKLLESKVPEWSDSKRREKDVAEMATILNDNYGFSEQELRSTVDHRMILMARDAIKWQKLQKSKPATLNKVRLAPKLIRPGSTQSRAAQDGLDIQKGRDNLRRTGRVQDATPLLRKLIFNK